MSGDASHVEGLRILNVGAGGPDGVFAAEDEARFPHFSEFLNDVRSKLCAPGEAVGRQYQREVVNRGALEIISPLTAERVRAVESFLIGGRIFYSFCENEVFYLGAARIKFGYPLIALFVPRANVLVKWEIENDKRGIEAKHIAGLTASVVERRHRPTSDACDEPVTIVMGHKNFAHHLWNELPALEQLLAGLSTDRNPRLLLLREPLGPIDTLFPEVSNWRIERPGGGSRSTANPKGELFVNLGSFCVTSSIRKRLLIHARKSASGKARKLEGEIRTRNAPVFWVSVRIQTPTPTNQRELLTELGIRILKDFPNCTIVFDGFSLPEDWKESDDIHFYRAAARKSRKEIDATIAAITGCRLPLESQRFVNLGGWGILDCIAIASLVTAYFCHVGTTQHKIGWTTNVPGMIHANRRTISIKSAVWYAPSRLENGVMPAAIPPQMVTPGGKEDDYRILDPTGVAETVCEFFRKCVSERQA